MKMILESSDGSRTPAPSLLSVQKAIDGLENMDDGYVVIGPDEMTYVQCLGNSKQGYILEYQEGDTDQHFQAINNDWLPGSLADRLWRYADGDPTWKEGIDWERIEI